MNEEEQIENVEAVSEQPQVEPQEKQEEAQEEQKLVPLAALQAERRKRQDTEARVRVYEEMMSKQPANVEPQEEEDPEELLTKGSFNQEKAMTKREILEEVYQDSNPEAVQKINKYLKPILDKKPWLAKTVDDAVNRLSRANEIVEDYMHLVEVTPQKNGAEDARKIIENAKKPRSPVQAGKSAQPTGIEYLKSIQGKKEFREYRQKILRGEV